MILYTRKGKTHCGCGSDFEVIPGQDFNDVISPKLVLVKCSKNSNHPKCWLWNAPVLNYQTYINC